MREKEKRELKEGILPPESVGIVTTVHYPKWYDGEINWADEDKARLSDKVRGDLAIKTITEAKDEGYQVVVIDSEISDIYSKKLIELGIKRFAEKRKGMSPSRQQGFDEASKLTYTSDGIEKNIEIIGWIEPEKIDIIKHIKKILDEMQIQGADLAIPKRSLAEFRSTYPDYQFEFETASNRMWNRMLRAFGITDSSQDDFDVWFGPRFFRNTEVLLPLFLKEYKYDPSGSYGNEHLKSYKPDRYSNATFIPPIAAIYFGFKVISVEIPYLHPSEQTRVEKDSDEFRKKRADQQNEIIRTCADFCRYLLNRKSNTLPKFEEEND